MEKRNKRENTTRINQREKEDWQKEDIWDRRVRSQTIMWNEWQKEWEHSEKRKAVYQVCQKVKRGSDRLLDKNIREERKKLKDK